MPDRGEALQVALVAVGPDVAAVHHGAGGLGGAVLHREDRAHALDRRAQQRHRHRCGRGDDVAQAARGRSVREPGASSSACSIAATTKVKVMRSRSIACSTCTGIEAAVQHDGAGVPPGLHRIADHADMKGRRGQQHARVGVELAVVRAAFGRGHPAPLRAQRALGPAGRAAGVDECTVVAAAANGTAGPSGRRCRRPPATTAPTAAPRRRSSPMQTKCSMPCSRPRSASTVAAYCASNTRMRGVASPSSHSISGAARRKLTVATM